jgi:glycosyltransferase involved in cell wall biosynthesis
MIANATTEVPGRTEAGDNEIGAPSTSIGANPFISVVLPVRNEAKFIADLLRAVFAQDYPAERLEVVVADGMSTDGTRAILERAQAEYPGLIVVDNPRRIVSTGLNLAVGRAKGDIIIRIDGHAVIARDFVTANVALLAAHPEAWSVGGPIQHAATTIFGHAVALAMAHPIGVGNARHRYPDFEGYVEGAQFPAIRRWVFDRIGLFDEGLVRNQDDEFNYRIARAGGRIYVSPRVQYSYFVRERIPQLFKQYFQYGFWRIPVIEKHRRPTTLRQMAPTLFYVACVVMAIAGWWWGLPVLAGILPVLYAASLMSAGAAAVRRNSLKVSMWLPVAIATMHAGYALGLGYGLAARVFDSRAWEVEGKMTTLSR